MTCETCKGSHRVSVQSQATGEYEMDDCLDCFPPPSPKSYWREGGEPGTAIFRLEEYLQDQRERERERRWMQTFGRRKETGGE